MKKPLLLTAAGVILTAVATLFTTPARTPIGEALLELVLKLVLYAVILLAVAALVAAVARRFRTHLPVIFGWLFLAAGVFNVVAVCLLLLVLR
jgi:ABC-type transport system involved in multi-copper enzyme maturation permease subunit